jgi:hypothetical protein
VLEPLGLSGFFVPHARRSKTRNSACGFIKTASFLNHGSYDRRDDQLRYAHAAQDSERIVPEVREYHLYFAAIIGIYGSGRVQHRDTMARRKTGTRPHLAFCAGRQRNRDPGWNECTRERRKYDRCIGGDRGQKIETGGAFALIGRQRQVRAMR